MLGWLDGLYTYMWWAYVNFFPFTLILFYKVVSLSPQEYPYSSSLFFSPLFFLNFSPFNSVTAVDRGFLMTYSNKSS